MLKSPRLLLTVQSRPTHTWLVRRIGDPQCTHVFEFMSQKIPCYSDNAVTQMMRLLTDVPIEEIWAGWKAKQAKAAGTARR